MTTNFGFIDYKFLTDGTSKLIFQSYAAPAYCGRAFPSCCGATLFLKNDKVPPVKETYLRADQGIMIIEGGHAPLDDDKKNKVVHTVVNTKNGSITVRIQR